LDFEGFASTSDGNGPDGDATASETTYDPTIRESPQRVVSESGAVVPAPRMLPPIKQRPAVAAPYAGPGRFSSRHTLLRNTPNMTDSPVVNQVKSNTDVLTRSGNAAISGFQELAKAYQELATRNAERLTASLQALAAVRTPSEFAELQRKLITEGVDAAVSDSSNIARLTAAVFAAAFEPVQKQVEVLQGSFKK
jgi:hypothetical protein